LSERAGRVISNLAATEYHGLPRLSSGGIKHLLKSPAHYQYAKAHPMVATPAMQFGTVIHALVLEPGTIEQVVAIVPDDAPDRRSNAGKVWWTTFDESAVGKCIMTRERYEQAQTAAMSVRQHPRYAAVFRPMGVIETSLLWHDNYGVLGKGRPDYLSPGYEWIVDLKTTRDASKEDFAKQMWNLRYDIQAAWYLRGLTRATPATPRGFIWGAVETEPPYAVAFYAMETADLEVAFADIDNMVRLYANCIRDNVWPGYPEEVQPIRLPRWASVKRTQPEEY
jgi:hypothetical protein